MLKLIKFRESKGDFQRKQSIKTKMGIAFILLFANLFGNS